MRLKNGTRYVVALHGLLGPQGQPAPVPEGFRRIRDGQALDHPVLGPLAERYEREIFPVLAAAGLERSSLQLAWDFSTQSRESVERDMLDMRSDLMARLQAEPPALTILEVREELDDHIFRRVEGTIEVPLYTEENLPGARLRRDAQGRVVAEGSVEVPFTMQIPRSVAEGTAELLPARVLQFGHGFFGSRAEADSSFPRDFANETGMVLVATDWWGMSEDDIGEVMNTMYNTPSATFSFAERLHQGMANYIALGYAVRSTLAESEVSAIDGQLVYDPEELYFYGISQGHILGGTFMALTPHIERATLSSGGSTFSFMMFRSFQFNAFLMVITQLFPDPLAVQKYIAMCQTALDRIDPTTWAPRVLSNTLPDGPESRGVLMQIGIGDSSVPNLSAHLHARAMGISLLQPAPRQVPALPDAQAPFDGSALVEFDYGLEPPLPGDLAVPSAQRTEIHDLTRRSAAGKRQIDAFFRTDGLVENFCEGPCDPD